MQRRKKIVIGNWKMAPATVEEARHIFSHIKRATSRARGVSVVICPSDVHLLTLAKLAGRGSVSVGVQDVFWEDQGLFTGQVSPAQAVNVGARFAIVGHSEKRKLGETNDQVAKKLFAVVRDGMTGILCVGEPERDKDGSFFSFLKEQILSSLSTITRSSLLTSVILAYEPIWEVGRSDFQAMKPTDVHQTSIFIRKVINDALGAEAARRVPIVYGGSVSPDNARAIVYDGEVDGLLVGRQSLEPGHFSAIIKSLGTIHAHR